MSEQKRWRRILPEGALIVVSVFLALSADAWWERVQEGKRADQHLEALRRDFDQMSGRAEESHRVAAVGADNAWALVLHLRVPNPGVTPDSAAALLVDLFYYEVFSPSVGAYAAMTASGGLEHLEDDDLKRTLADFFGSFEDMRASEARLARVQQDFAQSTVFAELVGTETHAIAMRGGEALTAPPRYPEWRESAVFRNYVAGLMIHHADLVEDYQFLRDRIEEIRSTLR